MVHNGCIFSIIIKGMYEQIQSGWIEYDDLVQNLAPYGYHPTKIIPVLWKHDSRPITFTLVVEDFGVKYDRK